MNEFCGLKRDKDAPLVADKTIPFTLHIHYGSKPSKFYTFEVLSEMRKLYHDTSKMNPHLRRSRPCILDFQARKSASSPNEPRKNLEIDSIHLSHSSMLSAPCHFLHSRPAEFQLVGLCIAIKIILRTI